MRYKVTATFTMGDDAGEIEDSDTAADHVYWRIMDYCPDPANVKVSAQMTREKM